MPIIPFPNESKHRRNKMDYFPVFVKLKNQKCLVIGAGEIAARKIDLLARAGANITVIANKISHHVSNIEHSCHLTVLQKPLRKQMSSALSWLYLLRIIKKPTCWLPKPLKNKIF